MAPLRSALWYQSSPHKLLLSFLMATLTQDVREMRGTTYSWKESEGLNPDLPSVESHQSHSVAAELLYIELFKSTGASRIVVRKEQGLHLGQPTSNWEGHLSNCHCHITSISSSKIAGIMNKAWFPGHLTYSRVSPCLWWRRGGVWPRTGRSSDLPLKRIPSEHLSHYKLVWISHWARWLKAWWDSIQAKHQVHCFTLIPRPSTDSDESHAVYTPRRIRSPAGLAPTITVRFLAWNHHVKQLLQLYHSHIYMTQVTWHRVSLTASRSLLLRADQKPEKSLALLPVLHSWGAQVCADLCSLSLHTARPFGADGP